MRVLIDECVPRRVRTHLPGHDVHTVPEMGWSGKKDGELLGLMAGDGFVHRQRDHLVFRPLSEGVGVGVKITRLGVADVAGTVIRGRLRRSHEVGDCADAVRKARQRFK